MNPLVTDLRELRSSQGAAVNKLGIRSTDGPPSGETLSVTRDTFATNMRVLHNNHQLPAFPVYSSAFLSENELVVGGGGGATKSGIKNKLVCIPQVLEA